MAWNKNPGEPISPETKVAALNLFNSYKMQYDGFVPPKATIKFQKTSPDAKNVEVHMDVNFKGTNFHLRSMKPEDHELVHTYLNSQPLVRVKYANKKTVGAADTQARVKSLAERFNTEVADGCFMHGGFVVTDNDTQQFLGIANSGFSGEKGMCEFAYLFRPDAWSHQPENIEEEYSIPDADRLDKDYSGVATAVVNSLVQYTQKLKEEGYKIKGEEISGVRATAMIDNPGSWKAMAKTGFEVCAVNAKEEWGQEIRYELELKL